MGLADDINGIGEPDEFDKIVSQPELADLGSLNGMDTFVMLAIPLDYAVAALEAKEHVADHGCPESTSFLAAFMMHVLEHLRRQVDNVDDIEFDQLFDTEGDDEDEW
jgi:hypothetical protein